MSSTGPTAPTEKFSIASELIAARTLKKFTQAQLAAESGLSLAAIKGYETGRTLPGAREIRQLSQALQITPNRLLLGTEHPFPEGKAIEQPPDVPTARRRIEHLLPHVTSGDAQAVFQLLYSLVAARHGVETAHYACRDADLQTGVEAAAAGEPLVAYLLRKLLVDTSQARQFAADLLQAADETDQLNAAGKVSK